MFINFHITLYSLSFSTCFTADMSVSFEKGFFNLRSAPYTSARLSYVSFDITPPAVIIIIFTEG